MVLELGTIVVGVLIGLLLTTGVLWHRAHQDVSTYLAATRATYPVRVYSAPMALRVGQQATARWLTADLLAAGYERVGVLDGPQQFRVDDDHIEVWTEPYEAPGVHVPGGRATLRLDEGRIAGFSHGEGGVAEEILLRPTQLAVLGNLDETRTPVVLEELSPWVVPAVLAMEDHRFHEHAGLDAVGILRALRANLRGGPVLQGGSTVTQQLAKNLFLTPERTWQRKVQEVFVALALERTLSKDEILETYLSEVYLGHGGGVALHGVEEASRAFFGISASRLSLAQAATVAGIISAPNTWSPLRSPERAQERRDLALRRMAGLGTLSEAEARAAMDEPVEVGGIIPATNRRAPWAVDAAVDALEAHAGDKALGGWSVHTHIQPLLQRAAEEAVREGMAELDATHPEAAGAQVALVALRASDGAVVAMVGGRDYRTSSFNRATHAWRQAGSTVKGLTLLAALDDDRHLTPLTRFTDAPIERPEPDGTDWTPKNYDGAYQGEVSLRRVIERSRNVPAVLLAEHVGLGPLRAFFYEAGLSRATGYPSAALGAFEATPLEVAGAYTAFPGGGVVSSPWLVQGAAQHQTDERVHLRPHRTTVASARATAVATHVLEGVMTNGTAARGRQLGLKGPIAGKTGTTDEYRDAWFVGFTPELVVAVWVGHDQEELLGLTGSRAALPTWARFLVASGPPRGDFEIPSGMVTELVCRDSHQVARRACEHTYSELFVAGSVPRGRCERHGAPVFELSRVLGGLFGGQGDDAPEEATEGPGENAEAEPRPRRSWFRRR